MERFVSHEHIDSNDVQFWYQLLSCSFNFMRVQDPRLVEKTLDPYIVRLTLNNSQSHNIGSLVRVFLDRAAQIKSPQGTATHPYYVFQTFNALYLLRCICKSYIENSSEEQLVKAFRAQVDNGQSSSNNLVSPQRAAPPQFQPQVSQQSNVSASQGATALADEHPQQYSNSSNGLVVVSSAETNQVVSQSNSDSTLSIDNPVSDTSTYQQTSQTNNSVNITDVPELSTSKSEITPGPPMLDRFISCLVAIIVDVPLNDSTYLLQVESINALIVLLSVQMYSQTPANMSLVYKCLMQKRCSIHALVLTKTLLKNFIAQQPMPQESGSIIIGLASGLWKVLTLGYGSAQSEEEADSMSLLAKQSLLLLNILTNHHTSGKNPYREAIVSCQDLHFNLSDPKQAFDNANNDELATAATSNTALTSNSIKTDFRKLYDTICKYLHDDQVALLLYILLHSNKIFRPYILTTTINELDGLILPLLKILYGSIERGSHHVYMVLIIFIILSEEPKFNEAIHKKQIYGVPWYKDRILSEISLGSLTVLILIKSFQYNTFKIKDKFLHTNLFATLANLSNYFHQLHPYVCQRMIDFLERLTKRYLASTKPLAFSSPEAVAVQLSRAALDVFAANDPLTRALATDTHMQQQQQQQQSQQQAQPAQEDIVQDASSFELNSSAQQQQQQQQQDIGINISIPEPQQQVSSKNDSNNNSTSKQAQFEQAQQQSLGNSSTDQVQISMDDAKIDLGNIEEVIRMLLEVINNGLATQLLNNSDLIYTLLYKREVFRLLLTGHQSFYNMVIDIERILTYFYNRIEAHERSLSVDEIKTLIQNASNEWNFEHQTRDASSRLLFQYVEDEQPEDFFIPYIWTRIYYSTNIAWNPKRNMLFNPEEF